MGLKHESVGELRRIIESCSTARANYLRQAEAAEAAAVNEHRRLTAEGKELRLKAGRLAEKERWARIYLAEKQEPYMLKEPSPLVKVDMADLEARVLAMEAENGNLKARLAAQETAATEARDKALRLHGEANKAIKAAKSSYERLISTPMPVAEEPEVDERLVRP